MTGSAPAIAPGGRETLAQALLGSLREARAGSAAWAAILVVGGAALTALSAQLAFKLPWSPVPYTGQTAAVLLVGTVLGSRLGALSMLFYVGVGLGGAPVFSEGRHGPEQLLGVTGGYLVGFVVAAAIVGRLAERGWDRSPASAAGLMAIGNLLIYAIGVPVLGAVAGMQPLAAAWSGAGVFLAWDAVKVAVAALVLPLAWRAVGERR